MAVSEDENLKVFYKKMPSEQLVLYRNALTGNLEEARRRRPRDAPGVRQAIAFCESRRKLIAEILAERGVVAS